MRSLDRLDLTMVRMKLLSSSEEGPVWEPSTLDLAEHEYRRFLALNLMYPDKEVVPCKLVDALWHAHILDTEAYARDCDDLFGYFLHHFPYFGLRGEEDATQLWTAYGTTIDLYTEAFGSPPEGVWRPEDAMKCERKNCKPQKCR